MDRLDKVASLPILSECVALHKIEIDSIRRIVLDWVDANADKIPNLQKAVEAAPLDDIFILRFILSHGNTVSIEKIATEYVQQTLEWRASRHEMLIQAGQGTCQALQVFQDYICRGYLGCIGGHCVFIERQGHHDISRLSDLVKYYGSKNEYGLDLSEATLISYEFAFRKLDEESRRTDRLCRMIHLNFLQDAVFKLNPNAMKMLNAIGQSSKKSAIYYPQLLGAGAMFSQESMLLRWALKISKSIISESTMNKIVICPGFKKGVSPNTCPGLKKLNPNVDWEQVLPPCANGRGPTPSSLISKRFPEEAQIESISTNATTKSA